MPFREAAADEIVGTEAHDGSALDLDILLNPPASLARVFDFELASVFNERFAVLQASPKPALIEDLSPMVALGADTYLLTIDMGYGVLVRWEARIGNIAARADELLNLEFDPTSAGESMGNPSRRTDPEDTLFSEGT